MENKEYREVVLSVTDLKNMLNFIKKSAYYNQCKGATCAIFQVEIEKNGYANLNGYGRQVGHSEMELIKQ